MSGYEIFDAIGEIDPALIERAERYVFKPSRSRLGIFMRRDELWRLAGVAAVFVVIGVGLFPYLRMIFGGFGAASGESASDTELKTGDTAAETFAATGAPEAPDETVREEERFPGFSEGFVVQIEEIDRNIELLQASDAEVDASIAAINAQLAELETERSALLAGSNPTNAADLLDRLNDKQTALKEDLAQYTAKKALIAEQLEQYRAQKQILLDMQKGE